MILKIFPPRDTLEGEKDEETIAVFVVKLNTCVQVGGCVCESATSISYRTIT